VALEIISRRPSSDSSLEMERIYLLEWVCYMTLVTHLLQKFCHISLWPVYIKSIAFHQYKWLLSFQAWHLHENNCEVELVDSRLSESNEEEVKRLIAVAFYLLKAFYVLKLHLCYGHQCRVSLLCYLVISK
jgi:hypothetical protein